MRRSTLHVSGAFTSAVALALVTLACGSGEPARAGASGDPPLAPSGAAIDGGAPDVAAPVAPEAGADAAPPPSRCTVTPSSVSCAHEITELVAGVVTRDVYWQTPSSPPPPGGYPVVVVYQGSFGGPSLTWATLTPETPFGGYQQGRLHALLLERGFTVVAPEAAGGVAWQTNSGVPYAATTDKQVVEALLASIGAGVFGPADTSRLYATGISSGGYMTSRMAVSHAGVFRALAIQSASYATCLGAACLVPSLPADHPPTLLLHGALDVTVPLFTAEAYHAELVDTGVTTEKVVDEAAGHEWLPDSPERITAWFETH